MIRTKIASLEIQNEGAYIEPVLCFFDTLAVQHTQKEFDRYSRMRYVIGAILENRIKNAYPGGHGPIFVEFYMVDAFLEVSIKDKGIPEWRDFSYDKEHIADEEKEFRNYLMDKWIDEVGIEHLGKEGQRVFLRQRVLNPINFKPPAPYQETEVLDTNISIRPVVTEEDAVQAIRCIYSEYGYSYSYEALYHVNNFMRMINERKMMSFLAVNDHGQVAGHFCLTFSEIYENMPEVSTVVIRKEFRSLGLFAMFMEHSIKVGREEGFRALMGQPVAFHPMSQKAVLRSGFTPTSLLLSYIDSALESEYNKDTRRLDLFACVKILDDSAGCRNYPPKELTPFIKKMYDKLGLKYEFSEDGGAGASTQISIEDNGTMKVKKIVLYDGGDDLKAILKDAVQDTIRRKSEMIELMISLDVPSCGYCYRTAAACGFTLSGIMPGGASGDYIIMQMLMGTENRYEHLVMVGEFEELTKDVVTLNEKKKEEAGNE